MRILIVGAGALGGYFGARLLAAGRDVTFLLRPRRVEQLARTGLVVRSRFGDLALPPPAHVLADAIAAPFDLVIVGCKAYDLEATMNDFAPAVGPDTAVLPLLNGMAHIDALQQRFGPERVLGGLSMISAALDGDGLILHFNDMHAIVFGELDGSTSPRVQAIAAAFGAANFVSRASTEIRLELWEKWVFIASAAGITCLMRAAIGDIVAAGAADLSLSLLDECRAIAAANGHAPRDAALDRARTMLSAAGSPITASMLKDVERGGPVEADHVLGDLLRRSGAAAETAQRSLLRLAWLQLKAYEARRARGG